MLRENKLHVKYKKEEKKKHEKVKTTATPPPHPELKQTDIEDYK